jgi:hypothetical protein
LIALAIEVSAAIIVVPILVEIPLLRRNACPSTIVPEASTSTAYVDVQITRAKPAAPATPAYIAPIKIGNASAHINARTGRQ